MGTSLQLLLWEAIARKLVCTRFVPKLCPRISSKSGVLRGPTPLYPQFQLPLAPLRLKLTQQAESRLEVAGLEFLARFLEIESRKRPDNIDALAELGHALTRLGRVAEGLEVDRRLVRLAPENSTVHYNLACSLCLLERPDEALDALERSVELGYDDASHLLADEDLSNLRDEPRFIEVIRKLSA